jgi:glutamate racemase
MVQYNPQHSIGIFDSGLGGLTIAKSIIELLPQESIIYFGDTAHLPYGDKSATTIEGYSLKIADFLLQKNCKVILIACNSASAAAYEAVKAHIKNRALLVNVIDPVIQHIEKHHTNQNIGLIGTKLTIKSNVYKQKIAALNKHITLKSLATPLLVPIIEEGFFDHQMMRLALEEYLSHSTMQKLDALILGCTHYPIVKQQIMDFYRGEITIIDPREIVGTEMRNLLTTHNLLNTKTAASHTFYVSDYTEAFANSTKIFFKEALRLIHLEL